MHRSIKPTIRIARHKHIARVSDKHENRLLGAILFLAFLFLLNTSAGTTLQSLGLPSELFSHGWRSQTCSTFVSLVMILICATRQHLDLFAGCAFAALALTLLSTVYNGGNATPALVDWLPCIAMVSTVALLAKRKPALLITAFFAACTFYLICNLYYLLTHSSSIAFGAFNSLPTGYRNVTFRFAIPAFTCSLVLDSLERKSISIRTATVYIISLFEILAAYSATSALAFLLMGGLCILWKCRILIKWLNALSYAIGYLVLFFGFVILRIQYSLGFLIEPVLHRSVTFTGRTELWDQAITYLANSHFITGYGSDYTWNMLKWGDAVQKHAHNDVLNILMLGGVGALITLTIVVGLAIWRLYRLKETETAAFLSLGLAGFFTISLVEVATCPGLFFLLAFAYYYLATSPEAHLPKPEERRKSTHNRTAPQHPQKSATFDISAFHIPKPPTGAGGTSPRCPE